MIFYFNENFKVKLLSNLNELKEQKEQTTNCLKSINNLDDIKESIKRVERFNYFKLYKNIFSRLSGNNEQLHVNYVNINIPKEDLLNTNLNKH